MNLTLTRTAYELDGIFGILTKDDNDQVAVTLEHAYPNGLGGVAPKIPAGTYTCKRGMHQLEGMKQPFETFEVTNVPGHTNILLHMGNYNGDSDGCILVGRRACPSDKDPALQMITSSVNTFNMIMDFQRGVDEFQLTVKDKS